MADVIRYIDVASTPGGDGTTSATSGANRAYASFDEWNSAEATDLVTATNTHTVRCASGTDVVSGTGVNLSGWTTSATYFLTIEGYGSGDHLGVVDNGYIISASVTTSSTVLSINKAYTVVRNISVYQTHISNGSTNAVLLSSYGCLLSGVISKNLSSASNSTTISHNNDTGNKLINCVVFDSYNAYRINNYDEVYLYNCGAYNCTNGFVCGTTGTLAYAYNCVAVVSTTGYTNTTRWRTGCTNNASSSASYAPGANPIYSVTSSDFANYAGNDFMPDSGGLLYNAGADQSGVFTHDITGATRSQWDVGPYAYIASGSTSLTVADLTQGQTLDNVTLTQHNVLAVNDITHGQTLDNVTLTQANVLAVADVGQAQSLDNVTLTQAHIIAVADLAQGQSLDGVTLTQANILAVADITQAQTIDASALVQHNILAVDALTQGQTLDNLTLTVAGSLAVQAIAQAQSIDGITLTQANILSVADLTQQQALDASALVQHYAIAVSDILQAQALDNITLTVAGSAVAPDDLAQAQSLDAGILTEHAVIAVQDLTQQQIIDIITLGGLVIGELQGTIVSYALIDGEIRCYSALGGTITLH